MEYTVKTVGFALLLSACSTSGVAVMDDAAPSASDLGGPKAVDDVDLGGIAQAPDLAQPPTAVDMARAAPPPDLAKVGAPPGSACDPSIQDGCTYNPDVQGAICPPGQCAEPTKADVPTSGYRYFLGSSCGIKATCCQYATVYGSNNSQWDCYRCSGTMWKCCSGAYDAPPCWTA